MGLNWTWTFSDPIAIAYIMTADLGMVFLAGSIAVAAFAPEWIKKRQIKRQVRQYIRKGMVNGKVAH